MSDVDDLLTPRAPSFKFKAIGDTIKGTITHSEVRAITDIQTGEVKHWDDGKVQKQIVITLATDLRDPDFANDDGERRIFAGPKMRQALIDALTKCGPGTKFETGGMLAVRYNADGEAGRNGFNAPKLYVADYRPPASAADSMLAELANRPPAVAAADLL